MRNEKAARVFLAMCEPARLQILQKLAKSKGCVQEIGKSVGRNQPNVSQHLRVLKDAGLVKTKREGKRVCYSLADERVKMLIGIAEAIG
ncbi:helix-turn-helix transcriptional regulator [Candidatus Micrarchaeota archaeon]|nr:helix-turn-helix transcriptional regulator [Candidatus Micrarchaeota archaeon]